MADDDATRHGGGKHHGPARTSPYPVSRLAPAHDLVNVAREIETADRMVGAVVGGKLEIIAAQIRALQEQAHVVLTAARRDLDLHRAECAFKKRPGAIYHLYCRSDDRLYMSMLSPQEWGGAPPHEHRGSYRLEADSSWTAVEDIDETRAAPSEIVRKLLRSE